MRLRAHLGVSFSEPEQKAIDEGMKQDGEKKFYRWARKILLEHCGYVGATTKKDERGNIEGKNGPIREESDGNTDGIEEDNSLEELAA